MANRVTPLTPIENLSGNISAAQYFDNNISPAFTSLNDASLGYCNYSSDTGAANAYVFNVVFGAPSAYNQGMFINFTALHSNTTASTVNVNNLGTKALVNLNGAALTGGEIIAGGCVSAVFDGTNFRMLTLPWLPVFSTLGNISTNQTVNCANASFVSFAFAINTTNTLTLTFSNLAVGIPINAIIYGNSAAGSAAIFFVATNPSGAAYSSSFVVDEVAGLTAGITVPAGKGLYFQGFATNNGNFFGSAILTA